MSKKASEVSQASFPVSDSKARANRHNAQLSTGPTSDAGKAVSSRNNLRHGLSGAFCVLPGEDREDFERLRAGLEEEHEPATVTESLLVNDMARHYWMYQRALRLQHECFDADLSSGAAQNRLSLFLRYGVTHERAFRRCLSDLLKLRKQTLQLERGFESQERAQAAERRREVAAQCRWVSKNRLGQVADLGDEDEVNDILEGFKALDDYFNVVDEDEGPESKRKGKGGRKAA
jgi:hypothetical protein